MMLKIVLYQLLVHLICVFIALVGFGYSAAFFLLLGGMCLWIPSTLFALSLALVKKHLPTLQVAVFFTGEIIKVLLCVLLLFMVHQIFRDETNWFALIIGLIVSLQANIIALMVTK